MPPTPNPSNIVGLTPRRWAKVRTESGLGGHIGAKTAGHRARARAKALELWGEGLRYET